MKTREVPVYNKEDHYNTVNRFKDVQEMSKSAFSGIFWVEKDKVWVARAGSSKEGWIAIGTHVLPDPRSDRYWDERNGLGSWTWTDILGRLAVEGDWVAFRLLLEQIRKSGRIPRPEDLGGMPETWAETSRRPMLSHAVFGMMQLTPEERLLIWKEKFDPETGEDLVKPSDKKDL